MSATAICEEQVQVKRERRPCSLPGMATLGQILTRAHEDALARGAADCPVCGGVMERAGAQGGCANCGSRLS